MKHNNQVTNVNSSGTRASENYKAPYSQSTNYDAGTRTYNPKKWSIFYVNFSFTRKLRINMMVMWMKILKIWRRGWDSKLCG